MNRMENSMAQSPLWLFKLVRPVCSQKFCCTFNFLKSYSPIGRFAATQLDNKDVYENYKYQWHKFFFSE